MTQQRTQIRIERMNTAMTANAADLLSYFRRRVTDQEDAADLLGDTALTAWRRIDSLPEGPEAARMWLFVTARHTLANFERRSVTRTDLTARLGILLRSDSRDDTARSDLRLDLQHAIAALAPKHRELITLVHWDGFTVTEAAKITRTSTSTARSRYAKARELLEGHVANYRTHTREASTVTTS
ncbi:sigma-70 family RNA polymerase sigma factor [Clavibacter michiganensis]|nr:sigma-70 family RNA polymerase sigma factor [Clavibacter michiganensis]